MAYIRRTIEKELAEVNRAYSVITITGPRQSGKTTLAKRFFDGLPYVNLESPQERLFAQTDPVAFLERMPSGAILDEIQRVPDLLSYIQVTVDERKGDVKYVLTGSSNFNLLANVSQSLAGRTAVLQLLPFSIGELAPQADGFSTDDFLLKGFYPAVHADGREPYREYSYYFQTYIERDIRQLLNVSDTRQFQLFVKLCAGRIGNMFNASALANEVGVSVPTIKKWATILETSYIIHFLPPWFQNIGKRLVKSPKLYFNDVGLASFLLGIETREQLERDPLRGALFENLILSEMLKQRFNAGKTSNLYFYRDSNQNEVDVVQQSGSRLDAFEIKSARTYQTDFLKGLKYFRKILPENQIGNSVLLYDGEMESAHGEFPFHNYKNYFLGDRGL